MPSLADTILLIGTVAATALIPALLVGLQWQERRVWPSPPVGSLRSFSFWSLFRTLNVAVLSLAAVQLVQSNDVNALQIATLALSAAFGVMYVRTLWELGRKATYCQASGLETTGVYRWTRNPQYATAIAAFGLLAAGVARIDVAGLALALIAVYALMAHAEEPWLRQRYGAAYDAYAARVPRFFNATLLAAMIVRALGVERRGGEAERET